MPMSLHAAMALSGSPSVRLMLPGGEARPGELAMVGPMALAGIRALRFDTVVLGCCGVSPEGHVMAHDLGDAAVKQALLASAGRSVLAVDGAKFGRAALAVVCPLSELDVVVTDDSARSWPWPRCGRPGSRSTAPDRAPGVVRGQFSNRGQKHPSARSIYG